MYLIIKYICITKWCLVLAEELFFDTMESDTVLFQVLWSKIDISVIDISKNDVNLT